MRKILVVAAHPDDEILGGGGTFARLAKEGDQVHALILGEGMTSRYAKRREAQAGLKKLHAAARNAAKTIGFQSLSLESFPDNQFDDVSLLKLVKTVESHIHRLRPAVIYTHHGGDLNIDHRLTFQAVLTATRPLEGQTVREIYTFETPSVTEWAFDHLGPAFRPNVFVDISKTFRQKIQALNHYDSEMRPFPHPRSPQALEAIAKRWGSMAHIPLAEAFELIRSVR